MRIRLEHDGYSANAVVKSNVRMIFPSSADAIGRLSVFVTSAQENWIDGNPPGLAVIFCGEYLFNHFLSVPNNQRTMEPAFADPMVLLSVCMPWQIILLPKFANRLCFSSYKSSSGKNTDTCIIRQWFCPVGNHRLCNRGA